MAAIFELREGSQHCQKDTPKFLKETIAAAKKITSVVFDRGGYLYTGRVAALADGARKGGLQF